MDAGAVPRDTIYAPSSGQPPAGVSVIRVSGPAAGRVVEALTSAVPPSPRRAAVRALSDATGALLDRALVLWFPGGASFTGEPVAEFHCHGGRAVVQAVMGAIAAAGPCRLADPGEFTLRAFLNGRMDLAEVEALGDLIAAETEAQRRQAARLFGGALHRRAETWRNSLLRALALVEVSIDWADEEVPEEVEPEVSALLTPIVEEIRGELAVADGAERLRHGFEVALLGAPNSGKSSLFNALAGRDAAITSPIPGTTRDVVELRYDLGGLPVVFLDTAGLRPSEDPIERIGVERAAARAAAADLRLVLASADAPVTEEVAGLANGEDLWIWTKSDLNPEPRAGTHAVSAVTGAGLSALLRALAARLGERAPQTGLIAHHRQRTALTEGLSGLESALEGLDQQGAEEVSEELRRALRALERLIGRIGVEDVLGEIFSAFCLGK